MTRKNDQAFEDMTIRGMELILIEDALGKMIERIESLIQNKQDEIKEKEDNTSADEVKGVR